jgi:hypothetical protein
MHGNTASFYTFAKLQKSFTAMQLYVYMYMQGIGLPFLQKSKSFLQKCEELPKHFACPFNAWVGAAETGGTDSRWEDEKFLVLVMTIFISGSGFYDQNFSSFGDESFLDEKKIGAPGDDKTPENHRKLMKIDEFRLLK